MRTFIVFAGPNGSGKSSVRDSIANPVEVIIDPDRVAREINPGDPRSVDALAGRAAVSLFEKSVDQGKSISMETTLTGHSAVMRMQRAKDAGYEVSLIYVALRLPEMNVRRVAARVRQGGHAIDPDIVRKRVGTSLANLPRALSIADQAIVLDNSGPTHRRVLETAAGRVTYLADELPGWLTQQMPTILAAIKDGAGATTENPSAPAGARPSLISTVFKALRRPESEAAAPWTTPPIAMAERLAAFVRAAAETAQRQKTGAAEPEMDANKPPRPSKGPRP